MSHWQRSVPDRQLWRDLIIFVCVTHLIVLFLLLYVYRGGNPYHIHVGAVSRSASVIFLPLHKSIRSTGVQAGVKNGSRIKGSAPRKKAKLQKKERAKKNKKSTSLKKEPVKPAKKKKLEKKQKKNAPAKKELGKEQVIEKPKIEELKPEPVPEPIPDPIQELIPEIATALETHAEIIEAAVQEGGPIYVGQAEMDALQMEELIQHEVEKHWKPPVGIDTELVCQIAVTVDWQGKAQSVRVIKKSGILMYDVQARSAVLSMNFPACANGKELMLHFKQ